MVQAAEVEAVVEFRILGPVEVVRGDSVLEVGGPRHRRLLAVLLLNAGRIVPTAKLIEALWGVAPPRSASAMLHVRVSELRASLRGSGAQLATRSGGYFLSLGSNDVDAWRFDQLAAAGATALAGGDPERASLDLQAGLALWRGAALAEFADESFAQAHARRLDELRLRVMEDRIAADLELGRHAAVVPELEKLVVEYPLRERFWAQLMLALYRTDRRGDALEAYQAARRHIIDQLGLDPGVALQELHSAILTADPTLHAVAERRYVNPIPPADETVHRTIPMQLPGDVSAFIGRRSQLRLLDKALIGTGDGSNPTVAVVVGTAGVGKTALAIHWAHQRRETFPDGQLYVNLRGYDPDLPMSATDVLAHLLAAFGVSGSEVPLDVAERAARFRSEIATRRMLIVADNASSVEQVRPLLPGTGGSAVLVTSRDSLAGLVAREGAQRVELGVLPPADAQALLRQVIGPRAEAEPDTLAALADRCVRLPLALRVAAELAIYRPTTSLPDLVDELADQQQRLDLLDAGGDPYTAVAMVFSWSIRHLPPDAARLFALLGLHPGPDFDVHAAAALAEASVATVRRTLDVLTRAHLVHRGIGGRYSMHDLLRAYATSLVRQAESGAEADDAVDRLFDYYAATAARAMDRLYPAEAHRRPRVPPAVPAVPDLVDQDAARRWLEAERPALVAVAAHAAGHDRPDHAVALSATLWRYLDGGHYADAIALHGHALRAATAARDIAGRATALFGLGTSHVWLSRHATGKHHLEQALALFRDAGDRFGEARAHTVLGIVSGLTGRLKQAAAHFERALDICRQQEDSIGTANALLNLGIVDAQVGRAGSAAVRLGQALALFRRHGDRVGEGNALTSLGLAEQRLSDYESAIRHLELALLLFRQLGVRYGQARALDNLGIVHVRRGDAERAADYFQQALAIYHEVGNRDGQAWALNGLGEAHLAAGRPNEAATHHAAALPIAVDIGHRDQQARAHTGLGSAHNVQRDRRAARHHYERALALYTELELPEADELRDHLRRLEPPADGEHETVVEGRRQGDVDGPTVRGVGPSAAAGDAGRR